MQNIAINEPRQPNQSAAQTIRAATQKEITDMSKQTCIRFHHECGTRSAAQWRHALRPLALPSFEHVSVSQSSTCLSFTALTRQASDDLKEAAVPYMRATANVAGRMLDVEMLEFTPEAVRTGYRWRYRIPKLVVARSGDEWDAWRQNDLTPDLQASILARLGRDLDKQLSEWLGKPQETQDLSLSIESAGRPMVITNAVCNPKPVAAMARLDVVFSSDVRLEGVLMTGLLQATGHGRIFRDGYQTKE